MALANFFHKAALAASHVLQGFDSAGFAELLESRIVGIAYDSSAVQSHEGRVTLDLLVNLLARLYPTITVMPLGAEEGPATELRATASAINPSISFAEALGETDVCVVVGSSRLEATCETYYVGSNGWHARFSPDAPTASGTTDNSMGAAAAACFGAANVFRHIFRDQLQGADPDQAFTLSLLDLSHDATEECNPTTGTVALGDVHLVGLGAIGNGAIWALSRSPGLTGTLHLIDHERTELTNLQRYVLATQADLDRPKVELAADHLCDSALEVAPHLCKWGEYLRQRNDWHLPCVAVAVDSQELRCAIQGSLPKRIVNAWTQPGDLGVSRHEFTGTDACLICLYLPTGQRPSDEQVVAEALGIPEAAKDVGHLLYTGLPVPQALVERAAERLGVPLEPLLPFVGLSLREFYSQAVCGGIVLSLQGTGASTSRAEVPLAFQSALSGILLAAELVAQASGLRRERLPTTTRFNLLRPLPPIVSFPAAKHPLGRCICQDTDYLMAFTQKYPDKQGE